LSWLAETLRAHPELALFLTLASGHALGRLRIGPIRLNAVIGVLLAGVVVGQLEIQVPSALQWVFFLLFLFSIGYQNGPQFFRGLGSSALPQVGLTLVFCGTALVTTCAVAGYFGLSAGTAAGVVAGSLTESAAIGTAGDAIAKLGLDEASRTQLTHDVAIAFAVTYLVGLLTSIGFHVKVAPWLMRADLAADCRKLEVEMGAAHAEPGVVSAYRAFVARAYSIPAELAGQTVAALEARFAPERVFVERVRTADGIADANPGTMLSSGDLVVLSGRSEVLAAQFNPLRQYELVDAELLDIPAIAVDVVLTRRDLVGRTLRDVAMTVDAEVATRGVFVRRITRAGQELPRGGHILVERGDVLTLVGAKIHVDRVAGRIGFAEWPSAATDLVTVAAAIAVGGMIGVPALRIAGVEIGLSLPVGVLLGGLVAGWLRSIHPMFGRIPEPALWIFDALGLTAFLACIGIGAGPVFVDGLRSSGLALVVAGMLVCAVPNVVTMLLGRYVLRIHPGVLVGICAGAGTSPFGLAAVQDAVKSRVPTLGYSVSYAVSNVLLALWGSVVVLLLAG